MSESDFFGKKSFSNPDKVVNYNLEIVPNLNGK